MKRSAGLLFLAACIALPPFLTCVWLRVEKSHIRESVKRQMIAGMPREQLVRLAFTLEEAETLIEWEHPGEFEHMTEMFDVVERDTSGDSVIYHCWPDREETDLNRALASVVARALGADVPGSDPTSSLRKFGSSLFSQPLQLPDGDIRGELRNPPASVACPRTSARSPEVPPPRSASLPV